MRGYPLVWPSPSTSFEAKFLLSDSHVHSGLAVPCASGDLSGSIHPIASCPNFCSWEQVAAATLVCSGTFQQGHFKFHILTPETFWNSVTSQSFFVPLVKYTRENIFNSLNISSTHWPLLTLSGKHLGLVSCNVASLNWSKKGTVTKLQHKIMWQLQRAFCWLLSLKC